MFHAIDIRLTCCRSAPDVQASLRAMLKRPRLFLTDRLHLTFDAARRNMAEALSRLKGEPALR